MEITKSEFEKVVKRAFVHGIACAGFFEDILSKEEQKKKIDEIIIDCGRVIEINEKITYPGEKEGCVYKMPGREDCEIDCDGWCPYDIEDIG